LIAPEARVARELAALMAGERPLMILDGWSGKSPELNESANFNV
jgi:hypothetical protein